MNIAEFIAFTDTLKLKYHSRSTKKIMNIAELITFTDTFKLKYQKTRTLNEEHSRAYYLH